LQEKHGCHFYAKAVNVLRGLVQSYDELFERYDIIVMPTIKYKAPRLPGVEFTVTGLAITFSLNQRQF